MADVVTDAVAFAREHPVAVAGAAYVLGATSRRQRTELLKALLEAKTDD